MANYEELVVCCVRLSYLHNPRFESYINDDLRRATQLLRFFVWPFGSKEC